MPDSARERMLEAATVLLLDRGYGATSLDEVCSAAGVTKGGLFYHFDSKDQLASAAIERFFARLIAAGEEVRAVTDSSAYAVLDAYIAALPELINGPLMMRGCLMGAMAIQTAESHPTVWSAAGGALSQWRAAVVELIEAAATERSTDVDAGELADGLLAAVEGGLLMARSGASDRAAVAAVDHFRRYLALLFGKGGVK
jgi:TetR/AcrR family transcriptional regulator, transcriptional repressor for nem operon